MTLELLNQYRDIKKEIVELEKRIQLCNSEIKTKVYDSVTGSAPVHPFTSHNIQIAGYPDGVKSVQKSNRIENIRLNRLARLQALEIEIEEYLSSITDSQLRQIITYRFLDGFGWRRVSRMIGHKSQDDQYPRRIVERHFK